MIRLLDRYVLGVFAGALGVFTAAFLALFVTIDLAVKLNSFLSLQSVSILPFMLRYYGVRLPFFLDLLLPLVVLFAAIFTVIKLARTNEILPIASSGTSLRRFAAPFLAAGLLAGLAIGALDEWLLPPLSEEMGESDAILAAREVSYGVQEHEGSVVLRAASYDHALRELTEAGIKRLDGRARAVEIVTAKRCVWDPTGRRWIAYEGTLERPYELVPDPAGGRPGPRKDVIPAEGYVLDAPFRPDRIGRRSSFSDRFRSAPLREMREDLAKNPGDPRRRTALHARFSFPCFPVILLLLALPSVVATQSKSFVRGLFYSFVLALAFYMVYFAVLELGQAGRIPAPAGAWGTTGAFGLAGLVSYARMRT
jgi:lipopolysaccharide export system permease protein